MLGQDVPAVYRPVYHTANAMPAAPMIVREPRPAGFGEDKPACEKESTLYWALKWSLVIGTIYVFRKPIGTWLAGFDPETELPGKAAYQAGRAVGQARRAVRRFRTGNK